MKLELGKWAEVRELFEPAYDALRGPVPTFAGISGGRTSAMLSALNSNVVFSFQNTGLEHPKTYEFLLRLEDALEKPILRLEYRPPEVHGARPRESRFAIVKHSELARNGEPFEDMLDALAAYRATNGDPPVAPWARGRLCTAHLKHKILEAYIKSLGITQFDTMLGLRHDEPNRVDRAVAKSTKNRVIRCPLSDAKITKADVLEFWSKQSFDLEIPEHFGNCTGCFLKDESDRFRIMGNDDCHRDFWKRMERKFPCFGGSRMVGYEVLESELEARLLMESGFKAGDSRAIVMVNAQSIAKGMDGRRYLNVIRQEEKRAREGPSGISCACESSYVADEDMQDDMGQLMFPGMN